MNSAGVQETEISQRKSEIFTFDAVINIENVRPSVEAHYIHHRFFVERSHIDCKLAAKRICTVALTRRARCHEWQMKRATKRTYRHHIRSSEQYKYSARK